MPLDPATKELLAQVNGTTGALARKIWARIEAQRTGRAFDEASFDYFDAVKQRFRELDSKRIKTTTPPPSLQPELSPAERIFVAHCFHESGHAVVGWGFMCKIFEVSVRGGGRTRSWTAHSPMPNLGLSLVIAVAGDCAEQVASNAKLKLLRAKPRTDSFYCDGMPEAEPEAPGYRLQPEALDAAHSDVDSACLITQQLGLDKKQSNEAIAGAIEWAERILSARKTTLATLAGELHARKRLTEAQIEHICWCNR